MKLEDRLRRLAKHRKLGKVTLFPTHSGFWQAGHQAPGSAGYQIAVAPSPIEALTMALGNPPLEYDGDLF